MNVEIVYRNDPDRPLTDPLPERNGVVLRLVRGDWLDPQWLGNGGGWFKAPAPRFTIRGRLARLPLPFIAWRFGRWSGYLGAKVYGVDSIEYARFTDVLDIYDGSLAFCLTARPFAKSE